MDTKPDELATLQILHPSALLKGSANISYRPGDGGTSRRELKLDGAEYLIGRGDDCHVVLDEPQVSRSHAAIRRAGLFYDLIDLGSFNGTFLNGKKIKSQQPSRLHDDDVIRIAGVELGFFKAPMVYRVALTDREREVLALIKLGFADKQIGKELHIAVPTVRAHITSMFAKTGATSRAHLVSLEL